MFVRICQECGHRHIAEKPTKQPTQEYLERKCKKCKSPALDYGSFGFILEKGKIVRAR